MSDYKERMIEAMEKREELKTIKIQEAEDTAKVIFERNKKDLVNSPLDELVDKLEKKCFENKFSVSVDIYNYVKDNPKHIKEAFFNKLASLIKSALVELSPEFCSYEVKVSEYSYAKDSEYEEICVGITMEIIEE